MIRNVIYIYIYTYIHTMYIHSAGEREVGRRHGPPSMM